MTGAPGGRAAERPDAVILLHGQPDTSATWAWVRHRLGPLPSGVRLFTPDRPGYGANPRPGTDFPGNVEELRRELDRHGVARAVLVGHSWAGGVALLAAARHPQRIAGLLLLASVGPDCLLARDRVLALPVVGPTIAYVGLGAGARLIAAAGRRAVGRLPPAERGHARMVLAAQAQHPRPRTFLVEQRALIRQLPLLDGALGEIRVPTLVLAGTADMMIPARTPRLLAERIPGAALRWVNGAPHQLPLHAPGPVVDAIRELLAWPESTPAVAGRPPE